MSRKLIDNARRRLAAETGCRAKPWGGRLSVALVYPNTYHQAMSNLGFLSIYQLLNSREDTLCERFFLPDAEDMAEHRKTGYPLFSLESGRLLADFDVIAFSISFENDYLNLPHLFDLANIPLWSRERDDRFPLVISGGVCAFLNPEPLADIIDLFVVGEGEAILPALVESIGSTGQLGRPEMLRQLASVPGVYVPSQYQIDYRADGTLAGWSHPADVPERVRRQWVHDLDATQSRSFVLTEQTEFSDMALTEISRGCSRGCRFCAAGFIYLPPRERSLDSLLGQIEAGLCEREKVGLVGAAVSDYSQIASLNQAILERGGKISVASLRIDSLTAKEVEALKISGHRTVALAPEAGSQRMRDAINKGLDRRQILDAVSLLAEGGIPNLKLYFLVGLPGEQAADIDEMLDLAGEIRELWMAAGKKRGRLGNLTLSVNPFIPKPFTPFQWAAMVDEKSLKRTFQAIRSAVARMPNTEVIFESPRSAVLQAFLARGDRRVGQTLPLLAAGDNLKSACRKSGLDPAFYVTRQRGESERFPWEILDSGVRREALWREYLSGLDARLSPRCFDGCTRCGVCD
ncbi:radical SAM protein [Trichloromonas sp.]|uniref:radical SAM protein n=1 Tax=Trichloromonas sp. TaxID=3069249 RepID=UPI003D81A256